MNRLFFAAGTIIGVLVLIMSVAITGGNIAADEDVQAGFVLWQDYGCETCHTLYGQGGDYAPDLTYIYPLRGDDYLRDFMVNPGAYHPNQRVMPRFTIDQTEISQLIAMFEWTALAAPVAGVWPPNQILVSGSAGLNINAVQEVGIQENLSPLVAQGRVIYRSYGCASCHSLVEGVTVVGPSFWNIANTAAERVAGEDAETYLRNSILFPSEYIVEGYPDAMQKNFGEVLSSQDIEAVIAYLMTFDGEVEP